MSEPFNPSQVVLSVPPLTATMGRSEREHAAALLVRSCQARGDIWQPIGPKELGEVVKADLDGKIEPVASLFRNPFFRPDFWDLVEKGFARWIGEKGGPLELTEVGREALRRWVSPALPAAAPSGNGGAR